MSIKVFMQTDKFKGGPAIFRSRLISSLNKIDGIEVVTDVNKKFDIELAFIRKVYKHNKPYILRASNCYYFNHYKPWNNKPIAKSIKRSDYAIFQSKFAYMLLNRVLRLESRDLVKNGYSIINNGIDLDYINKIEPSNKIEPGSFFACARWDPNKRPVSMIKGFIKADTKRHLYIAGGIGVEGGGKNLGKKYKSKYIHIMGEKTNEEIISIMKSCDYQIHLSFIDICPNIVIEGLSCGLNVLCANLGGTPELVGDNGVILKVDKFWKTKYLKKKIEDLDNLKSNVVANGIHELLKKHKSPDVSMYDINSIAMEYVTVIKKVLGDKK
jgi:glycosyltransferase involved in cell wall biosynthesis